MPPAEGKTGRFRGLLKRLSTGRLFGLPSDVDPKEVTQSGWAVVFPSGANAIRDRLRVLLEHRKRQVGGMFKELEYQAGESREQWLGRGTGPRAVLLVPAL